MMITNRISEISRLSGYPAWLAVANPNNICELVRVTGYKVQPDNQHLSLYITEKMVMELKDALEVNASISFLVASLHDFESYQIKGKIHSIAPCQNEDLKEELALFQETIDQTTGLGLDGERILGFMTKGPFRAIGMDCQEIYEQTPRPGTGNKIELSHE